MALTELKCPNCGANIVADSTRSTVSCIYCHTEFAVTPDADRTTSSEEAVGTAGSDILERAEVFLVSLHKADEAFRLFSEYAINNPGDYRGWLGAARALSDDFSKTDCDRELLAKIEDNALSAIRVSGNKAPELKKVWDDYRSRVSVSNPSAFASAEPADAQADDGSSSQAYKSSAELQNLMNRSEQLKRKIKETEEKLLLAKAAYRPPSIITKIFWGFLVIIYGLGIYLFYQSNKKKKKITELEQLLDSLNGENAAVDQKIRLLTAQ